MAGREDVLAVAKTFAGRSLTEGEEEVLSLLCGAAWDRWKGLLREEVTEADCGELLTVAAAWTALSAVGGALTQSLGRQAAALMAPFVRDEAFAFWEVEG